MAGYGDLMFLLCIKWEENIIVFRITIHNKLYLNPKPVMSGIDERAPFRPPFWSTPKILATTRYGMKKSLLIEILIGTQAESKGQFKRLHFNNINRDSGIEIAEPWMPMNKIRNTATGENGRTP